ncbi:MAG: magnesium chelatase domain-containing protein, partial [Bacteroidota bacterium]
MFAKTYGSAVEGIEAQLITIEVNVARGQFGFVLVGLPDNAVRESWARIETAFRNNGLSMPRSKIVVNMAPADIRKAGAAYDLPIALGILAGDGIIKTEVLEQYLIMGELSLDGSLRPLKGVLPIAIEARKRGFKGMIVPTQNASEAAIVNRLEIIPVGHLVEALEFLNDEREIEPLKRDTRLIFQGNQEEYA